MIREHYAAVKALIPSTVNLHMWQVSAGTNPDGTPKPITYPYAVLWGDLGDESSGGVDGDSLSDSLDVLSLRFRVTYAGEYGDSVLIACRNVRAALSGKSPVVAGWKTGRLKQATLMDAQADLSITLKNGSHPVYAVDEFSLVSHKL